MYFTSLPDHTKPGFDEQSHFNMFKKHNIVFNAVSSSSNCDHHVGCLSLKTVLSGEEYYGIGNHRLTIRPGQFLVLNNDQAYSSRIDSGETRVLSVFFKKEFAASVFRDTLSSEKYLLDEPFTISEKSPEFFQTLNDIDSGLGEQLSKLIFSLNTHGYSEALIDEYFVFLLQHLIQTHVLRTNEVKNVNAVKSATRHEIYKRLCVARDMLHTSYMDNPDLNAISNAACLSVPQLIRQFKSVFHTTPRQYLIRIRLKRASELLKHSDMPIHEVTWRCGFENVSAFCRAFKSGYGVQPGSFRK